MDQLKIILPSFFLFCVFIFFHLFVTSLPQNEKSHYMIKVVKIRKDGGKNGKKINVYVGSGKIPKVDGSKHLFFFAILNICSKTYNIK